MCYINLSNWWLLQFRGSKRTSWKLSKTSLHATRLALLKTVPTSQHSTWTGNACKIIVNVNSLISKEVSSNSWTSSTTRCQKSKQDWETAWVRYHKHTRGISKSTWNYTKKQGKLLKSNWLTTLAATAHAFKTAQVHMYMAHMLTSHLTLHA